MKARDIPIIEIIRSTGIEPRKRGSEWLILCPFHADSRPSLSINPGKNVWICWAGCGGGSGVDFIMRLQRMDFRSACQWIETEFNIKHDARPRLKTPTQLKYEKERTIEREIEDTFNFCFAARQALATELCQRSDDPPEKIILDLGLLETVSDEIASSEPERVASGLAMFRRWKSWGKASRPAF